MGVEELRPGTGIEPNASGNGVSRIAAPAAQPRVSPEGEEQTRFLGNGFGRRVPPKPSPSGVLRIGARVEEWPPRNSFGNTEVRVEEPGCGAG